MTRTFTTAERAAIRRLYAGGASIDRASQVVKIPRTTIARWVKAKGLKRDNISAARRAIIRRLYASGVSLKQIAQTAGVSQEVLDRWIEANGLERNNIQVIEATPSQRAIVERLYREGATGPDIYKEIGLSERVISRWLENWGIPLSARTLPSSDQVEILRAMFADGATVVQMSRHPQIHRSHKTVARWLANLGMDIKQRTPARRLSSSDPLDCESIKCGSCGGAALWMQQAQRYKCFKCRWESNG